MERLHQEPYLLSLEKNGHVEGITMRSSSSRNSLCHFFGGVRYALPPSERWRKAEPLPPTYMYGTQTQAAKCSTGTNVCPQPNFLGQLDKSKWDEDCFQSNIWVPAKKAPKDGWPVFVFFHGGFMQFGSPNGFCMAGLLGETEFDAIVVVPAYRLNLFGFLYSKELQQDAFSVKETGGNYGLWDQRLALEWVRDSIHLFGGDSRRITVAGYSAGAYSVFHQLAYDLRQPADRAIIKGAVMWSNGPGFQPKSPAEAQVQFNELLSVLRIPASLPGNDKLARLRALPAEQLVEAISSPNLRLHQFRPVTDSAFIPPSLFQSLSSGEIAHRLRQRNIRLILGECSNEPALYSLWRPPLENTLPSLRQRLEADYQSSVVNALVSAYFPSGELPPHCANWNREAFAKVYADMQIHVSQRGLVHALVQGGASHLLYRYRIEFRAKCVDQVYPPEFGATHVTDQYLWFWGNQFELEENEKPAVRSALVSPLAKFVQGQEHIDWGTRSHREFRTLTSDGRVEIKRDLLWDSALKTWATLQHTSGTDSHRHDTSRASRL
ncbi:hypothetical protein VTO42DRAFT_4652 [Malbranchea cinnamomea]